MKNRLKKYGTWSLVAGAAEGIGEAHCRNLAQQGMNILLVDSQKEKLTELSNELASTYSVQARPIHADLSQKEAAGTLMREVQAYDCRLLIINAAYGPVKNFISNTTEELDLYIDLNARTPLHLAHSFAKILKKNQKNGGIILMSSLAGLWGTQLVAPYSATKAFDFNLAEALHHELKPDGIDVLACCPGATKTPGYLSSNPKYGLLKPSVMEPDAVAKGALRKLGRGSFYIPGWSNKMTFFLFSRIFPTRWSAGIFNKTMRQMYGDGIAKSQKDK